MTLPKSFAPYFSAIWPISGPCVTHELWMFGNIVEKDAGQRLHAQVFGGHRSVFDLQDRVFAAETSSR